METVFGEIAIAIDPKEEEAVGPVGKCGEKQKEVVVGDEGKEWRGWMENA